MNNIEILMKALTKLYDERNKVTDKEKREDLGILYMQSWFMLLHEFGYPGADPYVTHGSLMNYINQHYPTSDNGFIKLLRASEEVFSMLKSADF